MKNKRVALYIRVSSEEQARQGLSLDAQLADLRSYADKHKYNIVGVYTDDGASARKKPFSRRAFKALIEDIKQNKFLPFLVPPLYRFPCFPVFFSCNGI